MIKYLDLHWFELQRLWVKSLKKRKKGAHLLWSMQMMDSTPDLSPIPTRGNIVRRVRPRWRFKSMMRYSVNVDLHRPSLPPITCVIDSSLLTKNICRSFFRAKNVTILQWSLLFSALSSRRYLQNFQQLSQSGIGWVYTLPFGCFFSELFGRGLDSYNQVKKLQR